MGALALKPDVAALGNWFASWVSEDGAIHGFHNHSVWGDNPYRWSDFTSGHTTWASPLIPGMAALLRERMDDRGRELLGRLIAFQTSAFQDNGEYRHIGFQVGETLKDGLIHNVHADVCLALAALYGRSFLSERELESIRLAIIRNMDACRKYGGGRADLSGTCNQDYARLWAKMLFRQAFDDDRWHDEIVPDLDFMIAHYHMAGLPDADSEGTFRTAGDRDTTEPAEYYGLMIAPLVLAYEIYGEERFLRHAGALCRHIVRSAWTDSRGQIRFHRLWTRAGNGWRKLDTPMLIAGMGHTLHGIVRYLEHAPGDAECADFVRRCDETYAHYQTPRGYFVSASGWLNEADVAPSTGWHGHDFHYLAARQSVDETFWASFWKPREQVSILLGDTCFWIEQGSYWAIGDYFWMDTFKLLGRKDMATFGRECPAWIDPSRMLPDALSFPGGIPDLVKTAEGIYRRPGHAEGADIVSAASVPYLGEFA